MTVLVALLAGALAVLLLPETALAHSLSGRVDSPLPFIAYVGGAAVAVGLSFFFVTISDPGPPRDPNPTSARTVPRALRVLLRALGLIGWLWIVAQALIGGSSDADVSYLFLWVYGWVGLAVLSALALPLWSWIDPFSTLYDVGSWLLRRLHMRGIEPQPYPTRLGIWPAIAGLTFFIWLELVARVNGGQLLGFVVIAYSVVTLGGMAQYGKRPWRENAETFSVWFGTLGRLAPFALVGKPERGRLHRRPFASGLHGHWSADRVVIVSFATASILYDGASQTRPFYDLFGFPTLLSGTLVLAVFLVGIAALVLLVGRTVGLAAMGAGLVPVALGYLIAHYFTSFVSDAQRILVALSDPFQQGWNLIGFTNYEPNASWLPSSLVWGFQVAAVVLGHVVGAWAGHAVIRGATPAAVKAGARTRELSHPASQLPLAILMICLTTATLWSLGQNLVFAPTESAASVRGAAEQGRADLPGGVARP